MNTREFMIAVKERFIAECEERADDTSYTDWCRGLCVVMLKQWLETSSDDIPSFLRAKTALYTHKPRSRVGYWWPIDKNVPRETAIAPRLAALDAIINSLSD